MGSLALHENEAVQPAEPGEMRYSRRFGSTRWGTELIYAGLAVAASIVVLSPVLLHGGWPFNQGTTAPLILVQMYAAHLRHFDLFPVWSSSDGDGMGSPVLLLYSRTFYYVAGLFFALTNNLKGSVIAALFLFLLIGAYGMRFALSLITRRKTFVVVGSLGFLFTNYAFTDWLDPRGDLGEFAAIMIVPWLLYCCLDLVRNGRVTFLFIPVMVVLLNSHNAIALVSSFSVLAAFVVFCASFGWTGVRQVWTRVVIVAFGTVILALPLLIADYRFLGSYNPQDKNVNSFTVAKDFVDFWHYFYDGSHRWYALGQVPPIHNFVQIDLAISIALLAMGAVLLAHRLRHSPRRDIAVRDNVANAGADRRILWFLLVSLAVYLFLQLRVSYFVYQLLRPLLVINFPWRMLAFITPLGVMLVVAVANRLAARYPNGKLWTALGVIWFAALLVLSPIVASVPNTYELHYGAGFKVTERLAAPPGDFAPLQWFTAPRTINFQHFDGFVTIPPYWQGPLYGVFLPTVLDAHGREILDDTNLYAKLHKSQPSGGSLTNVRCQVIRPSPKEPFETLELRFRVTCAGRTTVALPISVNPSSSVFVVTSKGTRQIPYFRVKTDPRMVIRINTSHPETIIVHLPTLWGTLF